MTRTPPAGPFGRVDELEARLALSLELLDMYAKLAAVGLAGDPAFETCDEGLRQLAAERGIQLEPRGGRVTH